MEQYEFDAGDGQLVVVYLPPDEGTELDPPALFESVAADAKARSALGVRLVSLGTMPLRHSALFMGREGSGFESKAAIVAVYADAMPGEATQAGPTTHPA